MERGRERKRDRGRDIGNEGWREEGIIWRMTIYWDGVPYLPAYQ
jgi:hypothetical protein